MFCRGTKTGEERTVTHDRKESGRKRQSDPGGEERRDNDS
jgi:hypothetical protein